jgi:integrase
LAAGTVKSHVGKLRAIFTSLGRINHENPASHPEVKRYAKFMCEEQAVATVVPRQATPFHPQKLEVLLRYLYAELRDPKHLPLQRYLLVRDIAFFAVDFFTGDRASDLGRLESRSVFRLSGEPGFLLNFTFAKTLRGTDNSSRSFALLPAPSLAICPVFWFEYYLDYCRSMRIDLHPGYIFRAAAGQRSVSDQPFTGSAVNNRLRAHLIAAGIHSGETPHSFRTGIAITFSVLGFSVDEIAEYVGWRSLETARHYARPAALAKRVAVFSCVVAAVRGLAKDGSVVA